MQGWEDGRLWGAASSEKLTALLAPFLSCCCWGRRERLAETGREHGRGHHPERAVVPVPLVVDAPVLDEHPSFGQAGEELDAEQSSRSRRPNDST